MLTFSIAAFLAGVMINYNTNMSGMGAEDYQKAKAAGLLTDFDRLGANMMNAAGMINMSISAILVFGGIAGIIQSLIG